MTRCLAGWLMMALCVTVARAAPPPVTGPRRLLQAKEWDGNYTIRRWHAELPGAPGYKQWTHLEVAAVRMHLKYVSGDEDSAVWQGTAVGNVQVDYHERTTIALNGPGAVDIHSGNQGGATVHSDAAPDAVYLEIDAANGTFSWGTSFEGFEVPSYTSGQPAEFGVPMPRAAVPAQYGTTSRQLGDASAGGELPAGGQSLQGSEVRHGEEADPVNQYSEEFVWRLTPVLEPIELVVEPTDYADWIPNAAGDEITDGAEPLQIRARLQRPGGGEPPRPATSIRFELVHASAEPGVCNNWPGTIKDRPQQNGQVFLGQGVPAKRQAAEPPQPDLRFILARNPELTFDGPQSCQTTDRPAGHLAATATLSCFDWGAYGTLMVTAIVPGYGQIVGHLAGDDARLLVPIPKRADNSLIADAWKMREEAAGLADESDDEDQPTADQAKGGHPGDGLTLYEEYRGFHENGVHIAGQPQRKDVFLVDAIGTARSQDGIRLFADLSLLEVHGKLLDPESESKDQLNFNTSGSTPRLATKYAIRLWPNHALHGVAVGVGEVGQPKEVQIGDNWDAGPDGWSRIRVGTALVLSDLYAAAIGHEILHTCSVEHHGENDLGFERWTEVNGQTFATLLRLDDAGQFVARGERRPMVLSNEAGDPLTLAEAVAVTGDPIVWVGSQGGQHSGDEDCVMRYDVARAYQPAGRPDHRIAIAAELTGMGLCDSPLGTGVNLASREPQPRYGRASIGDCRDQICVNDAVPH